MVDFKWGGKASFHFIELFFNFHTMMRIEDEVNKGNTNNEATPSKIDI